MKRGRVAIETRCAAASETLIAFVSGRIGTLEDAVDATDEEFVAELFDLPLEAVTRKCIDTVADVSDEIFAGHCEWRVCAAIYSCRSARHRNTCVVLCGRTHPGMAVRDSGTDAPTIHARHAVAVSCLLRLPECLAALKRHSRNAILHPSLARSRKED